MAPNGSVAPYKTVNVLMLSWKDIDDDKERDEFQAQLRSLSEEFRAYRFDVEEYEIESHMPYRKLSRRLDVFLRHDHEGALLIIYYGGHGLNNRDSHCIWLRDNPEDSDSDDSEPTGTNPAVNWSTLQSLFLDDCLGHVLFLLDCCYAGSSAKIANSASIVEVIAAAGFEQVAPLRGPDSFSTFLTKVLKEIRSNEATIVASVLARRISALLNSTDVAVRGTRVTPRHFPLHNGRGFIEIAPLLEHQLNQESSATIHRERKMSLLSPRENTRSTSKSSSHPRPRGSPKWGNALVDDHRQAVPQPPWEEPHRPQHVMRLRMRTPMAHILDKLDGPDLASYILGKHPIKGRQIRVLQIKPARFPERIICTLETIELLEKSTDALEAGYKALSWYCSDIAPWNSTMLILPEAQAVRIPNQLEAALRDIRDEFDETTVWVYQVCIDHLDVREVEEQTALVPDIFRQASEVIVWPGMEDNSSATALSFVPEVIDLRNIDDLVVGSLSPSPSPVPSPIPNFKFATNLVAPPLYRLRHINTPAGIPSPEESSRTTTRGEWPQATVSQIPIRSRHPGVTDDVPEKWKLLVDFMTRPYFARRWAFLEVALARSATIYCGKQRLSWSDFCDAITLLGSRFEEVRLLLEQAEAIGSTPNEYGQLTDLRALAAYSFAEASRELFPRHSDGSILGLCRLEKTVSALPALRSWHPNAVIYALLPLANDADEWDNTLLSPAKAYQHFVHHCARISGSVDIICRPWAPTQRELNKHTNTTSGYTTPRTATAPPPPPQITGRRPQNHLNSNSHDDDDNTLPSWVCQIDKHPFGDSGREVPGRRNGEVLVGPPDKPIYNASKSSRASPVFGRLSDSPAAAESPPSVLYDGTMTAAGIQVGPIDRLYARAADGIILTEWIDAFLGGPFSSLAVGDTGIVPDHLWRTLVADRGPGGAPAPAWYHRACHYWLEYAGDDDISYQKLKGRRHSSMVVQYLVRVRGVIWNRRLFTVRGWDGRVLYGLAPKETRDGDVVCVLDGCSVPVVMRPMDKGRHWILVGECFVYGIMDGEAVDAAVDGKKRKVQEFLIK